MRFTPMSTSWLNMVERFFHDITFNRLCHGVFTSVREGVSAADILTKVIRTNRRSSSNQNATLH